MVDPENTYIDVRVEIGKDTVIEPMTFLTGETRIGANCQIGPVTQVVDSQLQDNVRVKFSVLANVDLESGTVIAPFSHIRHAAEAPGKEISEYHKTAGNGKISP